MKSQFWRQDGLFILKFKKSQCNDIYQKCHSMNSNSHIQRFVEVWCLFWGSSPVKFHFYLNLVELLMHNDSFSSILKLWTDRHDNKNVRKVTTRWKVSLTKCPPLLISQAWLSHFTGNKISVHMSVKLAWTEHFLLEVTSAT